MTKRAKVDYPAEPYQWYREPRFCVEQLFDVMDFRGSLIWDPSCGSGNILDVAKARGYETVGSDIIDRNPAHRFFRANFLKQNRFPKPVDKPLSIICNPPYGTVDNVPFMANKFVFKALRDVEFYRAAFLVPIEFVCGQYRYNQIYSRRPPSHFLPCVQRPSMPPGAVVEDLGSDAFKGGMADYCWLVWTSGGPYRTELVFLPPESDAPAPVEKRIRN